MISATPDGRIIAPDFRKNCGSDELERVWRKLVEERRGFTWAEQKSKRPDE